MAFCCALLASTTQAAEIDYSADTKVVVRACLAHLAGKAPDASLNKAGFAVYAKNKRATSYRKNAGGGLLPTYFIYAAAQKPKDPSVRRCTILISLPKRLMVEFQSPEFYDFINALRGEMKVNGYKRGLAKGRLGQDIEAWTGRDGTYSITFSGQSPVIAVDIIRM